jgi:C-terminal processing protease CtpA/Prc
MKYSSRLIYSIALFAVILISSLLKAQELNDEQKKEIVNNIGQLLIEKYVFPDVGKDCASHIKAKLEDGIFSKVSDKKEFADLLTEELQSISKDKHMRVRVQREITNQSEPSNPYFEQYKNLKDNAERNYAFNKVEILDGGIGYIDLRGFAQSNQAYDVAVLAMKFLSNSNAIIFDLRKNGGGSPEMIRFILSYFFEKPTHINSLYWREGDRTVEFWTNEKVDGNKMSDVPMFVLTSNFTFSGGEEFTYDVQTQKRGVIIGEITGGGANPGGMFPAGNGLGIFIPTGRAINPVTNTNWEGIGVKPDIETSADDALDKALELAKVEAEKYKQKYLDDAKANFDDLLKN